MISLPFFNKGSVWKDGSFLKPWDQGRVAIYSVLAANYNSDNGRLSDPMIELPDEAVLNNENEIRFIAGGLEGAFGHHSSPEDINKSAEQAYASLKRVIQNPNKKHTSELYSAINSESALEYIDPLLEHIVSDQKINQHRLKIFAEWLVSNAPDRGPVKVGIAILGLYADSALNDLFFIFGAHEEFTLYATVAVINNPDNSEYDVWRIAKSVDGWGRIQAFERLADTDDPQIKSWMVREGYKNGIMNEYLAHMAATSGDMISELKKSKPDDALIMGAGDILKALTIGGPAEDMSDYKDGAEASLLYLNHLKYRESDLNTFDVVSNIRRYFTEDNAAGDLNEKILKAADFYLKRKGWDALVSAGIHSKDEQDFYIANKVADKLDMDTWDIVFERQQQHKDANLWWELMQTDELGKIRKIVEYAELVVPLDEIASGPSDLLGLGPEFQHHNTLDFIVQDLGKFPGEGWNLIRASLFSPVIRNRNMAHRALNTWPRDQWPSEATDLLEEAYKSETEEEVKVRIKLLIEGKDISQTDNINTTHQ